MEENTIMNEVATEETTLWDSIQSSNPIVDVLFAIGGAIAGVILREGAGAAKNAIATKMSENKAAPAASAQPKTEQAQQTTQQAQTQQQATQQQAQAGQTQ